VTWQDTRVTVVGLTPAGFAAADNLMHLGATVTLLAEELATGEDEERAKLLEVLGATLRTTPGSTADLPVGTDALVLGEEHPLALAAAEFGLPVWGELDLAWSLRAADAPPWLAIAGPRSGRVAELLAAMLRAGGRGTLVAGDGGLPLVEAVMDPTPYDVLVAALDAGRLGRAGGFAAHSAAVSEAGDPVLGRVYQGVEHACVYRVEQADAEALVREADVVDGARAIGVTLGTPGVGMVGVVDDVLADRAFIAERQSSAAELGTLADLAADDDPELLADALTAAALARAFGVEPVAVRDGLRHIRPA
jgi:UDP-N-acetylmuramoylalanine--D-glutamate ligase